MNGSKREGVSCPFDDHSFSPLGRAGVTAVFSGHDHGNDYHGIYRRHAEGGRASLKYGWMQDAEADSSKNMTLGVMRLAYGRKTGYGGYDPEDIPPGTNFTKGARVIVLRETDTDMLASQTYVRLENGTRVDQPEPSAAAKRRRHQMFCDP